MQISEEELRELVERAGGTIEVRDPSTIRRKRAPGRLNPAPLSIDTPSSLTFIASAEEPNAALTGAVSVFDPIMKLPKVVAYPLLILIFGGISAIFLPLFGSGSINSMTQRSPEAAPVAQPQSAPSAITACDEACVAKKKMARCVRGTPAVLTSA